MEGSEGGDDSLEELNGHEVVGGEGAVEIVEASRKDGVEAIDRSGGGRRITHHVVEEEGGGEGDGNWRKKEKGGVKRGQELKS